MYYGHIETCPYCFGIKSNFFDLRMRNTKYARIEEITDDSCRLGSHFYLLVIHLCSLNPAVTEILTAQKYTFFGLEYLDNCWFLAI